MLTDKQIDEVMNAHPNYFVFAREIERLKDAEAAEMEKEITRLQFHIKTIESLIHHYFIADAEWLKLQYDDPTPQPNAEDVLKEIRNSWIKIDILQRDAVKKAEAAGRPQPGTIIRMIDGNHKGKIGIVVSPNPFQSLINGEDRICVYFVNDHARNFLPGADINHVQAVEEGFAWPTDDTRTEAVEAERERLKEAAEEYVKGLKPLEINGSDVYSTGFDRGAECLCKHLFPDAEVKP